MNFGRERIGVRHLFREDIREKTRHERPKFPSGTGYVLDDHILERPLFALHQLSKIAELLLYKTTRRRSAAQYVEDCELFAIEVHRIQRNVLLRYGVDARIPRDGTRLIRSQAETLLHQARDLYAKVSAGRKNTCPCCAGRGKVTEREAILIKGLIKDAIRDGKLPPDFGT